MTEEIKLPEIAEGTDSAIVSEILVKEGDHVESEQAIIAVESDKATMEVPVAKSGTVKKISVKENEEVKVGQTIMTIEVNGDSEAKQDDEEDAKEKNKTSSTEQKSEKEVPDASDQTDEESSKREQKEKASAKTEEDTSTEQESHEDESSQETTGSGSSAPTQNIGAAPTVRRLARELGISLDEVPVKSKGGRISSDDLTQYVRGIIREGTGRKSPKEAQTLPDFSQWGDVEREPLSSLRKRIAESTGNAWKTIPHVTQFDQANAGQLAEYRKNYKARNDQKISVTAILVKIAGKMLEKYPKFNASIDMHQGEVIFKSYINISFAVDTPEGLLVPVIKNVQEKTISDIAEEINSLSRKARDRKIKPSDMQGGNFTISNLGGIGGTNFTPVIYPPQVAILGVSKTQTRPVMTDGTLKQERYMPLALSYDHRLIDGADAARFLSGFCNAIKNPLMLFE